MRVKGTRVLPPSYNPSDAYRRTRDHRQQPPACGRFLRHVTSFLPVRDGVGCRKSANRNPIAENRLQPMPSSLAGCLMHCTSSSLLPPVG